jgi:hypothetical protein
VHGRPHLTRGGPGGAWVTALLGGAAAVVVVAFLLLRDSAVEVVVPDAGADPACAAMADRLPSRLLNQERVATSQSSPAVAAWGDPAIIWRCGVTPPGPTTQDCIAVNGIDWVVEPLDDGTGFVSYGRDPAVQVLVPETYAPETFALTALSSAVGTVPQNEHRCS